jgi:hypothetical protein
LETPLFLASYSKSLPSKRFRRPARPSTASAIDEKPGLLPQIPPVNDVLQGSVTSEFVANFGYIPLGAKGKQPESIYQSPHMLNRDEEPCYASGGGGLDLGASLTSLYMCRSHSDVFCRSLAFTL